jgi:hypothetical protein
MQAIRYDRIAVRHPMIMGCIKTGETIGNQNIDT